MTVDTPKPLWTPSNPEKSQLAHFQNYIAKKHNRKFGKGPPNKISRTWTEQTRLVRRTLAMEYGQCFTVLARCFPLSENQRPESATIARGRCR